LRDRFLKDISLFLYHFLIRTKEILSFSHQLLSTLDQTFPNFTDTKFETPNCTVCRYFIVFCFNIKTCRGELKFWVVF
jgi:hypothetical protein